MLTRLLDQFKTEFNEYQPHVLQNAFLVVCGLLHCRTVCLYKLRSFVGSYLGNSETQLSSHYKRLTRFFTNEQESDLWQSFLLQGIRLFRLKVDYLILDGTKWKVGQRKYHFQTLSIIYKGVSIPIAWLDIEKLGSSNERERMDLFSQAIERFSLAGKTLIADREYVGSMWFNFLLSKGIDFVIRIRLGDYESQVNREGGPCYDQLMNKALNSKRVYSKLISIGKNSLWFSIKRNRKGSPKDPFIILLSSRAEPVQAYRIYAQRWQIEQCFRHLKSNGFDLQKLGLKNPLKVQLMMALVIFAYCISIHLGMKQWKKVRFKTYPDGTRYREISAFRLGLDLISGWARDKLMFLTFLEHAFKLAMNAYLSPLSIHVQ